MKKRNGIVVLVAFSLAIFFFAITPQSTFADGLGQPPDPAYDTVDSTGSSQSVIIDESDSNEYFEIAKVLFTLIVY